MSRLTELIDKTHKHGVAVAKKIAELTRLKRALEKLNTERRRELKEKAQPRNFTMYDSIEVKTIPANAEAVAGYVGGKWPTYHELLKKFPKAKHLSIAVNAHEDAQCLDVEVGDARPDQVWVWAKRQKAQGVVKPCLYASLSVMPDVKANLAKGHIKRSEVRLWVAHYTYQAHIPVGYDACQWTDKALNRNLDQSLCKPDFL